MCVTSVENTDLTGTFWMSGFRSTFSAFPTKQFHFLGDCFKEQILRNVDGSVVADKGNTNI